jgi:hypothetical protein
VSQQGQTFCYEPLEPDKNCLTPIKAEDPPLCPPKWLDFRYPQK